MMNTKEILSQLEKDILTIKIIDSSLDEMKKQAVRYQHNAPTEDYFNTIVIVEKINSLNREIEDMLRAVYTRRQALNKAADEEADKVAEFAEKLVL